MTNINNLDELADWLQGQCKQMIQEQCDAMHESGVSFNDIIEQHLPAMADRYRQAYEGVIEQVRRMLVPSGTKH